MNRLTKALLCSAALFAVVSTVARADEFDLTVNGEKVPRAQLELMFKENQAQEAEPAKLRQMVRQSVIRREVLAQQAIKDGLNKDEDTKMQIEMITRNALAAAYMNKALKTAVTDDDAKGEYDKAVKEYANKMEYQAKHILLDDEKKANEIAKSLKANPKKFAEIATKESKDPGSASRGGDLGWVAPGATVPEFEAALTKMKAGEISEPVKSQFGFHIIKLESSRKFQPPKFEDLKERIKQQLAREKADKIINDLVSKAKVQ